LEIGPGSAARFAFYHESDNRNERIRHQDIGPCDRRFRQAMQSSLTARYTRFGYHHGWRGKKQIFRICTELGCPPGSANPRSKKFDPSTRGVEERAPESDKGGLGRGFKAKLRAYQ
jgi:hypothetical protein